MKSCADCVCMVRGKKNFCKPWKSTLSFGSWPTRWQELRWKPGALYIHIGEGDFRNLAPDCKRYSPREPQP